MVKETPLNFLSCEKYLLYMIRRFDLSITNKQLDALQLRAITDELNRFKFRAKDSILSSDLKATIASLNFDFEELEGLKKGLRIFVNVVSFGIYGVSFKNKQKKARVNHLLQIKRKFYDLLAQIQSYHNLEGEMELKEGVLEQD